MDNTATVNSAAAAKYDRIISDLMTALDVIQRETQRDGGSLAYINGAVEQAMKMCNAQRERNADGYLVVKTSQTWDRR